jgi:5-methylthioadenosine/S-adenosylhomocysteine deaminase
VIDSPADLVITGCTALVHDDQEGIGFEEDATIVVRDGVIESVGTGPADVEAREVIDAREQVAIPGLINCHTHAPMVTLRGVAEDVQTDEWFNDYVWPIESNLTPKDVELGARLACAEMIRGGVTTFADHYFSMDVVASVVAEVGIRAHLGETFFSSQGPEGREKSLRFALEHRGAADGRITTALAPPCAVHGRRRRLGRHRRARPRARSAHPHPCLGEPRPGRDEPRPSRRNADRGATADGHPRHRRPHRARHWHPRSRPARARQRHRPRRGRNRAARLPEVRMADDDAGARPERDRYYRRVGHGRARVQQLARRLGVDGADRPQPEVDHRRPQLVDVAAGAAPRDAAERPRCGTRGGIGRLATGRRADIILVDISGPHTQPVHDHAATLVHSARSSDVRTTIVNGRVLMHDRKLLTIDVPAVVKEMGERMPALLDRSHGRRIQDYNT